MYNHTSPQKELGDEPGDETVVPVFAKFNDNHQDCILRKEADMLEFLKSHVPVPRVLHVSDHCLVLEYLHLENSNKHIPLLARVVGSLHETTKSDKCGFDMNNFHGPIAVNNAWETNWVTFFRNSRWKPLCDEMAKSCDAERLDALLVLADEVSAKMDLFFPTPPYLCLLHGDLHHGNWGHCCSPFSSDSSGDSRDGDCDAGGGGGRDGSKGKEGSKEGRVYLFDPLPLYGHNEFDLASLDCFVLPKEAFLEVYHRYVPREEVMFAERRMLYHTFFRLIGFMLTEDEEHLRRAHRYMATLLGTDS